MSAEKEEGARSSAHGYQTVENKPFLTGNTIIIDIRLLLEL